MKIAPIIAFKENKNMFKLKINDMRQDEYDGIAKFQVLSDNTPSQKSYLAHYNAHPDEDAPYKEGDIVEGDIYINSVGCEKKLNDKKLNLTALSKYLPNVVAVMKIKELVSDKIIKGQTNDIKQDIEVYFAEPVKDIKKGDVVELEGNLEVDFD